MNTRIILAAGLAAVVLAGCASDTTVGDDLQTTFDGTDAEGCRVGEVCATPTPEVTQEPSPEPTVVAEPSPEPAPEPEPEPEPEPTEPEAPQPQVALDVAINPDTGPSQFDPSVARIYENSCIRWTNKDTIARSVVADDGSFSSGDVAPGAEFVHCFEAPGTFNYHDGTRPYAVASVEVLAQ